jgi:hypothetical protein
VKQTTDELNNHFESDREVAVLPWANQAESRPAIPTQPRRRQAQAWGVVEVVRE